MTRVTVVCLTRELFDSCPMYRSVVETVCTILVTCTCVCCDHVFDVEDTELIVTYLQGNKL